MLRGNGFLLLIVSALLLAGCQKTVSDQTKIDPILVKTAIAKRQQVTEVVELSGSVVPEPNKSVRVTSLIPGVLTFVGPAVGDWVQKGEVVARLQDSIQKAQVHQTQAAFGLAKANWSKAEHGARPQEIEQARAALEVAKANALNAHQNRQRLQKLYDQEISAGRDYDLAISQERVADSQVAAAQAYLSMVLKGPRQEDRAAAKAQAEQAAGVLEQQQATLKLTQLTSPLKGVIAERYLDVGDQAGPATPVLLVVDPTDVYVQANLPVGYNDRLRQGQYVEIVPPDSKQILGGHIVKLGMKLDPVTNTVPVQIDVNPGAESLKLKFGMVVKARIVVERRLAIVVPKESVIGSADNPYKHIVNLISGMKSRPVSIETGTIDGGLVEIKSGLEEGDCVAININYELPEGTKVAQK